MTKKKMKPIDDLLISKNAKQIIKELEDYKESLERVNEDLIAMNYLLTDIEDNINNIDGGIDDLNNSTSTLAENSEVYKKLEKLSPDVLDAYFKTIHDAINNIKTKRGKK